jgi:hypothetical protein
MDPVAPIPSGATMTVWQEITLGSGQVINSPTVSSLPIPPFGRDAHGLAAPKLNTPLKSCATSNSFLAVTGGVVLSKVLPGAAVQLVVKGVPRSPSIVLWDDPYRDVKPLLSFGVDGGGYRFH